MKKLFFFLVAAVAICMTFAACNKNKGEDEPETPSLIGTWEYVSSSDSTEAPEEGTSLYYVFEEDSLRYVMYTYTGKKTTSETLHYMWTGNVVLVQSPDDSTQWTPVYIKELTASSLKLAPGQEETSPYMAFKRVSGLPK